MKRFRMKHDMIARRDGSVGSAWRRAQDETRDETNGIKTPDKRDTTGWETRRTVRKIRTVGAQRGIKSGRIEQECRASSAQHNGKAGEKGGGVDYDQGGEEVLC